MAEDLFALLSLLIRGFFEERVERVTIDFVIDLTAAEFVLDLVVLAMVSFWTAALAAASFWEQAANE